MVLSQMQRSQTCFKGNRYLQSSQNSDLTFEEVQAEGILQEREELIKGHFPDEF